jgi:DNA-binding NarL/FixJ family response regulator
MRTIPGTLDYARLAQIHRPNDDELLRREVLVLAGRGLTERDIGEALRIDATTVRRLLIEGTCHA